MIKYKSFTISLLIIIFCVIISIGSCGDDQKRVLSSNDKQTENTDKWGGPTREQYISDENFLKNYREFFTELGIGTNRLKLQNELASKLAECVYDGYTNYLEKEFSGVPPSPGHNYRVDIPKKVREKIFDNCFHKLRWTDNKSNSEKGNTNIAISKENNTYNYYSNPRYGFSVKYPSNFTKDNPADNGDGQVFWSIDKNFKMSVYGSDYPSVSGLSIKAIYKEYISKYDQVTYKVFKSDWFIISGYNKDKIFYLKSFVGNKSQYTVLLEYPTSEKIKYDDIVTIISKSFKPGVM